MRMCLLLVVSLTLTLTLSSHASANPFDDLTKDGDVCFHRVYEPAHLVKNPRQQTTSMTLWVTRASMKTGNTGLALTRRSDAMPVYLGASCSWEEYKPGEKSWMDSYKKQAGDAGCITLAVPDVHLFSSAEEGNGMLLDPAPDGQTVTVHLQDPQTMVKRSDRGRKLTIKLGKDDRVFLLRRTDLRHCARIQEALTEPEPGVKRR